METWFCVMGIYYGIFFISMNFHVLCVTFLIWIKRKVQSSILKINLTIGEFFAQIFGFWLDINQKYFSFLNRDFKSFWSFWSNIFFDFLLCRKTKWKKFKIWSFFSSKRVKMIQNPYWKKIYFFGWILTKNIFLVDIPPKIPLWLKYKYKISPH